MVIEGKDVDKRISSTKCEMDTNDLSLTITEVDKYDAGSYRLTAVNPVGESISESIVLEIMEETRETVMDAVAVLTLPPPDIARLLKKFITILISMLIPPPDPLLDARHRLCSSEHVLWSGRNVFKLFCTHVYYFYEITGESPDSFVDIVRNVFEFHEDAIPTRHLLTPNNRALFDLVEMLPYISYAIIFI